MSTQEKASEKGKVSKLFNLNLGKMTQLLNGEAMYKPLKADNKALEEAIAELAKEEKEALVKQVVTEARKMIQAKREFDKFVKQQRAELEKKVEEKQKEFNTQAKGLFALVDDVKALEKGYFDTLKNASEGVENKETSTEEDKEEGEE